MMKAGATWRDKNRIKKMHLSQQYTPEQISALTFVKLKHVVAIIKQVEAGTLRVTPPTGNKPVNELPVQKGSEGGKTSQGSYGEGEDDTEFPQIEQLAAEHKVEESHQADLQQKDNEIQALKDKLAEQEAEAAAMAAQQPDDSAEEEDEEGDEPETEAETEEEETEEEA